MCCGIAMLRSAGSLVVFEGSNGNHNNGSEWTAAKGVGLETAIARGPRVVGFVLLAAAPSVLQTYTAGCLIQTQQQQLPAAARALSTVIQAVSGIDPRIRTTSTASRTCCWGCNTRLLRCTTRTRGCDLDSRTAVTRTGFAPLLTSMTRTLSCAC